MIRHEVVGYISVDFVSVRQDDGSYKQLFLHVQKACFEGFGAIGVLGECFADWHLLAARVGQNLVRQPDPDPKEIVYVVFGLSQRSTVAQASSAWSVCVCIPPG